MLKVNRFCFLLVVSDFCLGFTLVADKKNTSAIITTHNDTILGSI